MKVETNIDNLIACASREVKMRKRVYLGHGTSGGGQVGRGKLTQEKADEEIAYMQSILDLLLKYKLETANQGKPITLEEYVIVPRDEYQNKTQPIAIKASYVRGLLSQVSNILSASEVAGKEEFSVPIPVRSLNIGSVAEKYKEYFSYQLLNTGETKDKIATFCAAFKDVFGMAYAVNPRDARIWKADHKKVLAPPQVMDFYMRCKEYPITGPKSIPNYLRHYQAILQLKKKVDNDKTQTFPGYFDKNLLDRLAKHEPEKYQKYRTHLTRIGFVRTQNPASGEVWKRKQ